MTSSDKKFNRNVWYVLKKIKELLLHSDEGNFIRYWISFSRPTTDQTPSPIEENAILNKFAKEFWIIKILHGAEEKTDPLERAVARAEEIFNTIEGEAEATFPSPDKPLLRFYSIEVLQPAFDKAFGVWEEKIVLQKLNKPLHQTKEPLHIVIDEVKNDIGIKGFEEKIVLQKPKNQKIQLRKFPADLKWEEISIQFLNEHEVIIKARNEMLQTTYEVMGFQDEKRKLPNKQWQFLRLLALKKGEVSWENNQDLPLKQINSIKKQKQLLTEALKAYFQIYDSEPFQDYKTEKAYRVKITLTPEPELKDINEREVYDE